MQIENTNDLFNALSDKEALNGMLENVRVLEAKMADIIVADHDCLDNVSELERSIHIAIKELDEAIDNYVQCKDIEL